MAVAVIISLALASGAALVAVRVYRWQAARVQEPGPEPLSWRAIQELDAPPRPALPFALFEGGGLG